MAGVENRVIDAASIPVDRRARRVKTDRLDLEQLTRMLLALERGETRACRVVRVPSLTEEDAKRQHRERAVLVAERTAYGNRITGLLMLGIWGSICAVAISSRISRPWSPLPARRCRLIPSRL